jgi:ribosomal protein S18 acetylase RimI-like enzyme
MMTIIVAEFTIEAYEQVYSLWENCDGIGLSNADSRTSIRMYLERNPGLSLIAFDDQEVVGTILSGHDGRRGYIHHLAVRPDYRRQGIGRLLVDKGLAALRSSGILKCHLFIFNDNTGGIDFWESIGWAHRQDIGVVSKIIE